MTKNTSEVKLTKEEQEYVDSDYWKEFDFPTDEDKIKQQNQYMKYTKAKYTGCHTCSLIKRCLHPASQCPIARDATPFIRPEWKYDQEKFYIKKEK